MDHSNEKYCSNGKTHENLAFHLIQAFESGETSYEEAHTIGKELANSFLCGKYSYVLATHTDKEHVHNHIIFCAVDNFEYKHYHDCRKTYWQIRKLSDKLCHNHNLSIINPSKLRGQKYHEWFENKNNNSWKFKIKKDIDNTIKAVTSYEEFLALMRGKGYEIKNDSLTENSDKYISFRPLGKERFVLGSIKSLGKNYTKEIIREQIDMKTSHTPIRKTKQLKHFIDIDNQTQLLDMHGLKQWISKENLKIAVQTYNEAKYQNSHNLQELKEQISSLQQLAQTTNETIISIEHQLQELSEIIKYMEQYQETKPYYEKFKKSSNPDCYFRKYETQIPLYSGAEDILSKYKIQHFDIEKNKQLYHNLIIQKENWLQQHQITIAKIHKLKKIEKNLSKFLNLSTASKESFSHKKITNCNKIH